MNKNSNNILDNSNNLYKNKSKDLKSNLRVDVKYNNNNDITSENYINSKKLTYVVERMKEIKKKINKILEDDKERLKGSLNTLGNNENNNLKDTPSQTSPINAKFPTWTPRTYIDTSNNSENIYTSVNPDPNSYIDLCVEGKKVPTFMETLNNASNNYYVRYNKRKDDESSDISRIKKYNEIDYLNFADAFDFTKDISFSPPVRDRIFEPRKLIVEKQKITIDKEINKLSDLIDLINENELSIYKEYNINMTALHNIKNELIMLNSMIGMHELKQSILDQIIYFIQDLHIDNNESDFLHTCIYGPPGTGKTEVAKIMGKLYSKLGILKKNVFRKVTRSDLIAGFLGQTALKTRETIESCLGGVMFIDEAYALGNPEKKDSFAKECIDTLCEALTDHKNELMVIIAGYEEELQKCFFSFNQGLESRFNWRFKTDDYNADELYQIMLKKIKDNNWRYDDSIDKEWFAKQYDYFKYFGRDIETLFSKVKIAHSRRVFCKDKSVKKMITQKDLEKGFELFCKNENVKKRGEKEKDNYYAMTMYC